MLALFLMARFRAPMIGQWYAVWFFISWLPSELPRAFGLLQLAITLLYLIVGNTFSGLDYVGLWIGGFTVWQWNVLHQQTFHAEHALKTALRKTLGENFDEELHTDLCIKAPSVISNRDWTKPFAYRRSGVDFLHKAEPFGGAVF